MKSLCSASIALGAALTLAGPVLAQDCPLVRAVYAPVEDEGFGKIENYEMTHSVKTIAYNQAQIVATIRAPANGPANKMRSYDFGFAFTNGYGGTHIVFSGESAKSANYKPPKGEDENNDPSSLILYFDEAMKVVSPVVDVNAKAAAYLIMPEIGAKFWYWEKGDRAFVPPGTMWKFKSCREK